MIRSNGSTVLELPDTTSGVPLVLAQSVKIRPGSNLEVPLECTRQLTDQMDIRIDTGFHHKNPNIYIPPCCINNPNNKHNPRYMLLTIFNLSTVDHLYIGKDTVIAFAEQPVLETYNIELASEDKIKDRQISMAMPKANNDHFSAKNTKFSSKEFIRLNSCETHGLNQIMTISAKNTKFSRQEFIWPYNRKIRGLDQNFINFVYFQVSGTHSHAPTDEKSSANRILANLSTCT